MQIDPSLWFDDEEGQAWVVVRAVRYPETEAALPANVDAIRRSLAHVTQRGFFAAVAVASAEDPFDPGKGVQPLYRGHAMNIRFHGLQVV